jgi:hypothetical protein
MKPQALFRRRSALPLRMLQTSALALLAALVLMAGQARAEEAEAAAPLVEQDSHPMEYVEEHTDEDIALPPLRVGDATDTLLALQRSGEFASATPRPIAGPVAHRSYERYLKSFEHPIPEYLNSSVKKTTGSSNSR